ncbi:penicillin-binding protein 1A [Kushneria phosphatilytica]|uniref:Penicillin-binding protein 1A n=1 Tax=Kushneria phosphatilytica TaxID=657387 RepID=A0A1S1NVB0_9GAMM|nr:penicillin-binding protein 1A [Kushneria phosphatilytica]OHV10508.1 penicillin-binding protein [Kushneria phosphatilytica]QEL11933.1 penicillin-binding protein 1A [Kushneria phosphatilytica]
MTFIKRLVFHIFWFLVSLTAGIVMAVAGAAIYFGPGLPDVHQLQHYQLSMPLRVYTADHKLIGEFGAQRRKLVKGQDIPPQMAHALMAAEDANFYDHIGVSPKGLARAALELASSGHIQSGGSTITMQVARNYLLTLDQTFTRKIREILLSLQMEQILDKQQILELYVNKIYLGQGAYGIGAAAETYFDKPVAQLSLPQMATIAGLPKAPSSLNPIANPERSLIRRNWVLLRMHQLGYIDNETYHQAVQAPIGVQHHHSAPEVQAPWVAEMARQFAVERFGDDAYTGNYRVITTINSKLQQDARQALVQGLIEYDTRHGWRGAEKQDIPPGLAEAQDKASHKGLEEELSESPEVAQTARQAAERSKATVSGIEGDVSNWVQVLDRTPQLGPLQPAIVVDAQGKQMQVLLKNDQVVTIDWNGLKWARAWKSPKWRGPAPDSAGDIAQRGDMVRVMKESNGDWRLSQIPEAEGAIVVLDPQTGALRALQGGFSFQRSQYNRATQAQRQPGSNFKPFIYLAALENGMTPATIINDAPIVQEGVGNQEDWRPENAERSFGGPTRLRVGLYRSLNLVTIRILRSVGLDHTLDFLQRMGFDRDRLPHGLSLALGSANLTPLEVARGYAEIANGGFRVKPWFISEVHKGDSDDNLLHTPNPPAACRSCDPMDSTVTIDGNTYPVAERIASPESVYLLHSIMRDVIEKGTGHAARALHRSDIVGKTGTTNDQRDAWFSGFNDSLVATVWVGKDSNKTIAEYGSQAALPIWMKFMGPALKGTPEEEPPRPDDIVSVRIDPDTGKRLHDSDSGGITEIFRKDNLPPYQERSVQPELEDESGSQGTGSYDAIF